MLLRHLRESKFSLMHAISFLHHVRELQVREFMQQLTTDIHQI